MSANLTETRGKRKKHTVEPLPAAPTEADVNASANEAELRSWWNAHPNLRPAIEARVAALKQPEVPE